MPRLARNVGASGGAAHFHATTPQAWTNCDERLQPVQPYPVKQGDLLSWREYKVNTIGGINVWFQNAGGIQWASNTTDGATLNQDRTDDQWLSRTLNLSRWVGDTILQYSVAKDTTSTSPNPWDVWVGDMAITSADGTVTQVIGNGGGATVLGGGCQGPSSGMVAEFQAQATAPNAAAGLGTHFFLDDHLGSAQMEFAAGGWPVWQGQFAPYGQEIQNGSLLQPDQADGSTNHYKFTGKERDAESGLDYFGARYYASSMGRWMSPDWSAKQDPIPYAVLDDPQSLNLYSYVRNNPLTRFDADGHCGMNSTPNPICNDDQLVAQTQVSTSTPAPAQQQSPKGNPGQPPGPPPVPVPGHPELEWEFHPNPGDSNTPGDSRGGQWGPKNGTWKGKEWGSPPSSSWDGNPGKNGIDHWDVKDGKGGQQWVLPDGTSIPKNVAHGRPMVDGINRMLEDMKRDFWNAMKARYGPCSCQN